MPEPLPSPPWSEALRVWVKIGLLSFGGPAGQIALMHRELVEKRRWLSDRRFLHALNFCMLLPGPEAQQLAIYSGWLLHRTRGGVVAGALFVLPGAMLIWLISCAYVFYGKLPAMEAVFYGLKAAVMAVVVSALMRIGKKVLKHPLLWAVAALSFVAIFALGIPFPMIVISALILGLIVGMKFPMAIGSRSNEGGNVAGEEVDYVISDERASLIPAPTLKGTLMRLLIWSGVWLFPLIACVFLLGENHVLSQVGLFFSKAAMMTFGGAYAVLPYVAQQAVDVHGWLSPAQMMDGLGFAETTPGPLVLVLEFVGFLGGWNSSSGSGALGLATLAAGMAMWATFIPGYLLVFVGGPFIERSRGDLRLDAALTVVTAAVVGVILNLGVWFGWHVVVPGPGRFDWIPLWLGGGLLYLLHWRKWGVVPVVGLGALIGLLMRLLGMT